MSKWLRREKRERDRKTFSVFLIEATEKFLKSDYEKKISGRKRRNQNCWKLRSNEKKTCLTRVAYFFNEEEIRKTDAGEYKFLIGNILFSRTFITSVFLFRYWFSGLLLHANFGRGRSGGTHTESRFDFDRSVSGVTPSM